MLDSTRRPKVNWRWRSPDRVSSGKSRLTPGATSDATNLHFYLKVNTTGTPPAPAKNIWYNAGIRSRLYSVTKPLRVARNLIKGAVRF